MEGVAEAPPNPIFHLTARFKADPDEGKMNLGVGAYRDADGKPWVLPVVKKAEQILMDRISSGENNHEYLPIGGLAGMVSGSCRFALGKDHPALERSGGIQVLSGTGALRTAGEFVQDFCANKDIYVSSPTWGNHNAIFKRCGLNVQSYRYYKPETRGLDFEAYTEDLNACTDESTVVLHACAHNPTGVDPTFDQWKEIAKICVAKKLFVVFDSAYQGFASGDPAVDAAGIRYFADQNIPFFVCQSYSKNFGLYNERAGCLMVCGPTAAATAAVVSQLKIIVRANWSNPPAHGAQIVDLVLNDEALYAEWLDNLKTMSSRIKAMRQGLKDALIAKKTPGSWEHITTHIGMFTFTGLTKKQVEHVVEKHHIYMLANGRINMCGVTEPKIDYLATAINDAVVNVDSKL